MEPVPAGQEERTLLGADDNAPYIIHQPLGDNVPTTREPGGNRGFVPAISPEVWVNSGDPTIHTTQP